MSRFYQPKIDLDPNAGITVDVYALRDDWAVHEGLKMAYQKYIENTSEERKNLGKSTARWEDFRVSTGLSGNFAQATLHDLAGTGNILTSGEFALSNVVDSGNAQRTYTWGSPTSSQYGILQEYDKKGNAPTDPVDYPTSGPYEELNTEVNATTMDDLRNDGNLPPYDKNGVNATIPFVKIATLGAGPAGDQKLSTGYFTAPCGIVMIVGPAADWSTALIRFQMKTGDYKGVHAPSMLE